MNLNAKPCSSVSFGLHSGAASGNLGLVKFALDSGQSIESCVKGLLPIHTACAYGHIQVVKYLLERGANVNARRRPRRYSGNQTNKASENNSTALHFAAANGHVGLVTLLLKWGAKVDIVDKYGSTPYSIALAKKNYEVSALLEISQNSLSTKSSTSALQHCNDTKHELFSPPFLRSGSTSSTVSLLDANSDDEKSYTDSEFDVEFPLKESFKSSVVNLSFFPRSKSVSDLRTNLREQFLSSEAKDKSNLRRFFPMYHKSPLQAAYLRD